MAGNIEVFCGGNPRNSLENVLQRRLLAQPIENEAAFGGKAFCPPCVPSGTPIGVQGRQDAGHAVQWIV